MNKSLLSLIAIGILLSACSDNSGPNHYNCDKQLDLETYKGLQDLSWESRYITVEEIEDNLIGTWQLVGIYSVWLDSVFYECITLEINKDKIVLTNVDTGEETTTPWEVVSYQVGKNTIIYLKTDESFKPYNPDTPEDNTYVLDRMGMEVMSENYMYGSGRVIDANSYLYEKID